MKKAFTTAELLIAMTVIGVIAVLVVPTFIRDYNLKVYSATIKDVYTSIESAIMRACADSGVEEFERTSYVSGNAEDQKAFITKYFKAQEKDSFASEYKSLSGSSGSYNGRNCPMYTLHNGAAIRMCCTPLTFSGNMIAGPNPHYEDREVKNGFCTFYVDINGKSDPNVGGLDMFTLTFDGHTNTLSHAVCVRDNASGREDCRLDGERSACTNSPLGENCIDELINNDWKMDLYTVNRDDD